MFTLSLLVNINSSLIAPLKLFLFKNRLLPIFERSDCYAIKNKKSNEKIITRRLFPYFINQLKCNGSA